MEVWGFSRADRQIPDCARGILHRGQQQGSARAQVSVSIAFLHSVIHLEIVCDCQSTFGRKSDERIAIVAAAREAARIQTRIEDAVGVEEKNVARTIRGESRTRTPNRAFVAVGSYIQH